MAFVHDPLPGTTVILRLRRLIDAPFFHELLPALRNTYVVALVFTLLCVGWLLSGVLFKPKSPMAASLADAKLAGVAQAQDKPTRVRARVIRASAQSDDVLVRATTATKRVVEVRAMVGGRVMAPPVERGTAVQTGAVLCQLDPIDRRAWVAEGEANVMQARLEYQANVKLRNLGFQSETQEMTAKAKLAASEAGLQQRRVDLDRTVLRAPFTGIVEERSTELGAFLQPGQPCATIVAPDPMLIVGQVAEKDIGGLKVGQLATAALIDGQTATGRVTFLGLVAQAQTRTYRVEITVPNADHRIRSGITADLRIPKGSVSAQHLSPAVLALDDKGGVGVRILDAGNVVHFVAVKIIRDDATGVWVTGLPELTTLITIGQEQVVAGQKVEVVYEVDNPEPADDAAAPAVTSEARGVVGQPVHAGKPAASATVPARAPGATAGTAHGAAGAAT